MRLTPAARPRSPGRPDGPERARGRRFRIRPDRRDYALLSGTFVPDVPAGAERS